jgi:hypothetical protein
VVASFSISVFAGAFGFYRWGMSGFVIRVITGWAGVAYVLLSGFAFLALLPYWLTLMKQSQSTKADSSGRSISAGLTNH